MGIEKNCEGFVASATGKFLSLECSAKIKNGYGSQVVLVWFQHEAEDTFQRLSDELQELDWGKIAMDTKGEE